MTTTINNQCMEAFRQIESIAESKGYGVNIDHVECGYRTGKIGFYLNGSNAMHVTLTVDGNNGDFIVKANVGSIGGSRFCYPHIKTADELIKILPDALMTSEEANRRYRGIAAGLGMAPQPMEEFKTA